MDMQHRIFSRGGGGVLQFHTVTQRKFFHGGGDFLCNIFGRLHKLNENIRLQCRQAPQVRITIFIQLPLSCALSKKISTCLFAKTSVLINDCGADRHRRKFRNFDYVNALSESFLYCFFHPRRG